MDQPLRILALLPFVFSACAAPQGMEESGPNFGSGKADDSANVDEGAPIWAGEQVIANLDEGRYIAHAFEGYEGGTISAEIQRNGTTNRWDSQLWLYLLDGDERMLVGEDDEGGYGSLSRLELTLPADGQYELVVGGKDDGADYRLTLLCDDGECGPEAPSDVTCPAAAQERMWTCLEEAADEQDFETRFDRLIRSACATSDYFSGYIWHACELDEEADEVIDCDAPRREEACERLMGERVGPSDLGERLEPTELEGLAELANSLENENCRSSSGCYLEATSSAFRFDPSNPPVLSELLGFARSHNEVGTGVYPATLDGQQAVEAFDDLYGFRRELSDLMDEHGLNADEAVFATGDNAQGWYLLNVPVDQTCFLRLFLASFPSAGISFEVHVQQCWAG